MATKSLCKIDGCGKAAHQRGWCSGHYKRWWRHGDPLAGRASNGEPLRFLQDLVSHKGDECVAWPYRRYKVGYGKVLFEGRIWKAHRLLCTWAHGEPPTPCHEAAHGCGNANCVNPQHLRWATRLENAQDKQLHGTQPRGERLWNAKLTEASVREIRRLCASGMGSTEVAKRFGIRQCTVSNIKSRMRWAHVE